MVYEVAPAGRFPPAEVIVGADIFCAVKVIVLEATLHPPAFMAYALNSYVWPGVNEVAFHEAVVIPPIQISAPVPV
jgi:hypothetical protein